MKPITPQDYVNCYGTFVADVVKISSVYPSVCNWFKTSFPDLFLVYQVNKPLFDTVTTSIRVPGKPTFKPGYGGMAELAYDKNMGIMNATLLIDLKGALACAEVDPSLVTKLLNSWKSYLPKTGGK